MDFKELLSQSAVSKPYPDNTAHFLGFRGLMHVDRSLPFVLCCPQLLVWRFQRDFLCGDLVGMVLASVQQGGDWSSLPGLFSAGHMGLSFLMGCQQTLRAKKLPVSTARSSSTHDGNNSCYIKF